jgi:hypothetical protein
MAGLTPGRTGNETGDALAAVMEDQAERKQRQNAPRPRKPPGRSASLAVFPLAALTLWFVFAPPAILRPSPVPAPSMDDIQNGLRMDLFVVARQVIVYRDTNGRLPSALVDALSDPAVGEDITYEPGPNGTFEISGVRNGLVVLYSSTTPLSQFVAGARAAVRNEPGS